MADVEKIAAELRVAIRAFMAYPSSSDESKNALQLIDDLRSVKNLRLLLDELSRLREAERRAKEVIREQAEELLWNGYNAGVEHNGRWWDSGISDAQWVTRELGLPAGWNDIAIVTHMIPNAAERVAARALSAQVEERE